MNFTIKLNLLKTSEIEKVSEPWNVGTLERGPQKVFGYSYSKKVSKKLFEAF